MYALAYFDGIPDYEALLVSYRELNTWVNNLINPKHNSSFELQGVNIDWLQAHV